MHYLVKIACTILNNYDTAKAYFRKNLSKTIIHAINAVNQWSIYSHPFLITGRSIWRSIDHNFFSVYVIVMLL